MARYRIAFTIPSHIQAVVQVTLITIIYSCFHSFLSATVCNTVVRLDFFFLYQLWRRSLGHPQIRYCFLEGECHLGRLTFRTKQTSDFLKVLAEIRSTEILIKMTRGFAECDKLLSFCTFTCCDILIRKLQRKKQICRAICTEREGQYEPYIQ